MRWLTAPDEARQLLAIARIQDNLDFRAGMLKFMEDARDELLLKGVLLVSDIEYKQNQGRVQVLLDLIDLCKSSYDWALKAQAKAKTTNRRIEK